MSKISQPSENSENKPLTDPVLTKKNKNSSIRVLVVDISEKDFLLTKSLLENIPGRRFEIDWCNNYKQAVQIIKEKRHDINLIDYQLDEHNGIVLLNEAIIDGCAVPIIIFTEKYNQKVDIEAMKSGAADYLIKDKLDSFLLERYIRYALERAQTLEAIKRSEWRYRSIFENSIDVIFITDREGNFIDISNSASKLLGYSREELLSMKVGQLFERDPYKTMASNELYHRDEIVLLSKSGEKVYCILTASIHRDGNEEYFQGILHDVTKRRKAEQQLINSEKLSITGRIAHIIAHEVRNPLTNVTLSLEQLKHEFQSTEDAAIYFDIIKRNCERINQLITELLNSAKPAHNQFSRYSVNKLVDESLDLGKDRIKLKGIKIDKQYEEVGDIYADAGSVKTAILNIILNAVEAMEHTKGELKIKTSTDDDRVVLTISDNGQGMSSEILEKLFEPFYSSKPNGMGLGLTSAQNIIYNHKGTIDIESEIGKGTTFIIGFDKNYGPDNK
jgi:PAS domain S-box-containing protein